MLTIYRVAKNDNLYSGPLSSGRVSTWEHNQELMSLEVVTPKEATWLYGFTEDQKNLVLDYRTLNKLSAEGFCLYVIEVPEDSVEIHEDQVCFNPDSITEMFTII